MSGNIKQWDIWWADVKFEETDEVKRRPVLIVNPQKAFVMALKMTSRDRGDSGRVPRERLAIIWIAKAYLHTVKTVFTTSEYRYN